MTAARRPSSITGPSPHPTVPASRPGRRWLAGVGLAAVVSLVLLVQTAPAQALPAAATARMHARTVATDGPGVHVSAAPGKPGNPVAVAGAGQATSTNTPPAGGGPVTGYYVTLTDDRSFGHCITSTTTCVFTGLRNGDTYTFQVLASNGGSETSTWSDPSNAVTPRSATSTPTPSGSATPTPTPTVNSPASPVNVSLSAGPASLIAAWSPVTGATEYSVTAYPGPSTCVTVGTSCVLGAVAGRAYTVTVVARSGAQVSSPSAAPGAVVPTTPAVPATLPAGAVTELSTDHGQIGLTSPGAALTVTGSGFAPYSSVRVAIYSSPIVLDDVIAGSAGSFSLPVVVPAGLAGAHTLLAAGIDPAGHTRQITLPVTVAGTETVTTGTGSAPQTTRMPVPAGGGIWLLDPSGRADTAVANSDGTYTVDRATGVISFVPVAGFSGPATPVGYRLADALGTVVNGSYTPIVVAAVGTPVLKLATRIVSGTGRSGSAAVSCRISTGVLARCVVTASAVVSGRNQTIGYGVTTPALTDDVQTVTVPAVLTELGRYLAARPGGVRVSFSAELTQRNQSGTTRARGSATVVAKTFTLSRAITFGSGSPTLAKADSAYLKATAAKLTGARSITCTGHADRKESRPGSLALSRARAACTAASTKVGASVHTAGKIEPHPKGAANTPAARAHNRRVTLTIAY